MFHTLQDFTAHAKGMGYLMAGVLLLLLIPFWLYLTSGEKKHKKTKRKP